FEGRSHLWPSKEFENVERSGSELKKKLDDLGLLAADVFLQMAPYFEPYAVNHPPAERRAKAPDWFSRAVDYASACGSKHVTTLPGVQFENESREDSYLRTVEELAWRVEQSKSCGIVFGVEAHVGSIVPDPKLVAGLVNDVPGLTLTLDYTH